MMIQKIIKNMEEFTPKTGFNVVGIDDFELPGEQLFLVKHFETKIEAVKYSQGLSFKNVVLGKEKNEK